jgi:uncharacterized membrane protein YhiD involved in acid resistance
MDETVVKLLLAVLVGALIGAEREVRVGVGLRTMMLICLGAAIPVNAATTKAGDVWHHSSRKMETVIQQRHPL